MCKKMLFLLMAGLLVLAVAGNASAAISVLKESVDFDEKWEGNIDPCEGGGYALINPLTRSTDGDIFTMFVEGPPADPVLTGRYDSDNWTDSTALDANGWTFEIRLKLGTDYADKAHFKYNIKDNSGYVQIVYFYPNKLRNYSNTLALDINMVDGFHVFRVAQEANSDISVIYLDNDKIGEYQTFYSDPNAGLWWGSGDQALYGTTEIDYVRIDYSGGYRPKLYKPVNPLPADGVGSVSLDPTLTWLPGDFAASHDVYFGTADPPPFIQNQPGASYTPATLSPGTDYYWQIDEVNGASTWVGNLWSFTTAAAIATQPGPADYLENVLADSNLTWAAGLMAASHDVYFGDTYPPPFIQNQPGTTYAPPALLDSDTMYFWRIDEVNGSSTWTGDTWRFTVIDRFRTDIPPQYITATAMSEYNSNGTLQAAQRAVDGSGLHGEENLLHDWALGAAGTQWMSGGSTTDQVATNPAGAHGPAWIHIEFDQIYELGEMWVWNGNYAPGEVLDRGFKTTQIHYTTDGQTWTKLLHVPDGNFTLAKSAGTQDYAHDDYSNDSGGGNNEVDFGGVDANGVVLTCVENFGVNIYQIAEIRFYKPVPWASRPDPYDGKKGVPTDKVLSWMPGEGATSHNFYFGTTNPPPFIQNQSGTTYSQPLFLGNTYYWRVDEVNASGTVTGKKWNFEINNYLLVDDMEVYASNPIYNIWNDGYVNYSGSWIDTTALVTYNGEVAMDLAYDNRASYDGYSEVDASITAIGSPTDWTQQGIKALTLHFHGDKNNDANETMYVALKDGDSVRGLFEVRYGDKAGEDMNDIKREKWQEWNIDLTEFTDAGINIANVERIYIGFDDSDAANRGSTAGGTGTVFFDDISIYLPRCVLDYTLGGDITGPDGLRDCVVDKWDVKQMAADWLLEDSYASTVDPNTTGLVGYWRLDETIGITALDSSGNDYHGTLLDGPLWTSDAVYLNALEFDGIDDHVFIDDDSGNAPWEFSTESFSVSMWVKTDTSPFAVMLVNGTSITGVESGKRYELTRSNGLMFAIDDDERKSFVLGDTGELTTGDWVHIVAIRDRSLDELRIYSGGLQNGDAADNVGDISSPGEGLYFGSVWNLDTTYYDGKLDDIRIYNKVLTDTEITTIAEKGEPSTIVYQPLTARSELSATEAEGSRVINFIDYSTMANDWQEFGMWPK